MKRPLTLGPEKFRRNFDRAVTPAAVAFSCAILSEDRFRGGRRGDRFFLCRQRRGRFALCPVVLRGTVSREGGADVLRLVFTRNLGVGTFLFLWFALLAAGGAALIGFGSPVEGACLLAVAAAGLAWLFLPGRREKARLLAFLEENVLSGA